MRHLLFLGLIFAGLCACDRSHDRDEADETAILDYLQSNNLEAFRDASGLYFYLQQDGTGRYPTDNSEVEVKYRGYFLDGTEFANTQDTTTRIRLAESIPGWRIGMKRFNIGSVGRLYMPSRLAYGRKGLSPNIPGDAILIFEVELVELHPHF